MSNISQFFAGSRKKNRKIIQGSVGVTTVTWVVPPGVTEVEVHCWGAGGNGGSGSPSGDPAGGGGGGGYVTHVFPVTSSDQLLITAGASPGGTSSVSIPTQSPSSPISATGGAAGANTPTSTGGVGGVGAYTIAPGISTVRTFSASGGSGAFRGGGGAAGSPQGNGGSAVGERSGGGGIGGDSRGKGGGGGSLGEPKAYNYVRDAYLGGAGIKGIVYAGISTYTSSSSPYSYDDWFYVDEILGSGGPNASYAGIEAGIPGESGGGGGSPGGHGGILGGGGGGFGIIPGGTGGLAGGGGGGSSYPSPSATRLGGDGGAGLVILYW